MSCVWVIFPQACSLASFQFHRAVHVVKVQAAMATVPGFPNWHAHQHPNGRTYYQNDKDYPGETVWDLHPKDWEPLNKDLFSTSWRGYRHDNGKTYYQNQKDYPGVTVWNLHPKDFEALNKEFIGTPWLACPNMDGKIYYKNEKDGEVVWMNPNVTEARTKEAMMSMNAKCSITGLIKHAPKFDKDIHVADDHTKNKVGCIFYDRDPLPFVKSKFTDRDFWKDTLNPRRDDWGTEAKLDEAVREACGQEVWRRPNTVPEHLEFLFGSSVDEGDVRQGHLSDCWLLGSIAAVCAKLPNEIRHMINYSPQLGCFSVKLHVAMADDKPLTECYLLLDDEIAVKKDNPKQMVFASSVEDGELWSIFLEKAFAKWCGAYPNLQPPGVICSNLSVMVALQALTGYTETLSMPFHVDDQMVFASSVEDHFTWQGLLTCLKEMWVVVSAARSKDEVVGGLVANHMFSIIDAVEIPHPSKDFISEFMPSVKDESLVSLMMKCPSYQYWKKKPDGSLRLVKLRNPWGNGEWQGLWSDNSPAWDFYPELKKRVGHTSEDDGEFFIQWVDFKSNFSYIQAVGPKSVDHKAKRGAK